MNKTLLTAWNIINGIVALALCYQLIFMDKEETGKAFWLLPAIFFTFLALRGIYSRKLTGKNN